MHHEHSTKPLVPFEEVSKAIRSQDYPPVDLVVGIGSGGTIPATLVAFHLKVPLRVLWVNYRDEENQPVRPQPEFTVPFLEQELPSKGNILLVDDVAVSGKTLEKVMNSLPESLNITTLVLKGKADIVLLPHLSTCVKWPWKAYATENLAK
ncbi:phosphoribosyltransferase [Pleomorphovibrio marinus]|uniref:phosphoribosyltransferase n=1 Tax=Pleomorphovibrio marinus TaxID=2164132 RepID=UPI000E0A7F7C|nr:phosphoribosyltransferase [Pleomorphovibrio marinus]